MFSLESLAATLLKMSVSHFAREREKIPASGRPSVRPLRRFFGNELHSVPKLRKIASISKMFPLDRLATGYDSAHAFLHRLNEPLAKESVQSSTPPRRPRVVDIFIHFRRRTSASLAAAAAAAANLSEIRFAM